MALAQKFLAIRADHKTHMRHRVDKLLGRCNGTFLDQVRPELSGHIELAVHSQGSVDTDSAIGTHRRVVQLAIGGVTCACVVPCPRAFLGFPGQALQNLELQVWLQLLQEYTQGRTHNARTYQCDINLFPDSDVSQRCVSLILC